MRFVIRDPKKARPGSVFTAPGPRGPKTQHIAFIAAEYDAISCASSLSRDRPLTTGNGRFVYFLAVLHFRKLLYSVKIGSHRNDLPVI